MHSEFARATGAAKLVRYQAEAREPKIKLPSFRRRRTAERGRQMAGLSPRASG